LLFDERITIYILIGGAITLLGVWLVNKAFKTGAPIEQPEAEGI
jgi:drug/metabolite transporter (DMT)-like permease